MKSNKKATELSFNTIIVAVIALIVLIVVVMILTGKMWKFGEETTKIEKEYSKNCEIPGTQRQCRPMGQCTQAGGYVINAECTMGGECCSQ